MKTNSRLCKSVSFRLSMHGWHYEPEWPDDGGDEPASDRMQILFNQSNTMQILFNQSNTTQIHEAVFVCDMVDTVKCLLLSSLEVTLSLRYIWLNIWMIFFLHKLRLSGTSQAVYDHTKKQRFTRGPTRDFFQINFLLTCACESSYLSVKSEMLIWCG